VRSRVFRWYGILRVIEDEFAAGVDPRTLLARVDELDDRLEREHVPLSYTDELYALRSHLALVRRKLHGRDAPPVPDDASRVH
jgi:hypothetical protein